MMTDYASIVEDICNTVDDYDRVRAAAACDRLIAAISKKRRTLDGTGTLEANERIWIGAIAEAFREEFVQQAGS